jgi:hypothetical protein
METALIAVLCGAAVAMALFVANIVVTAKTGTDNKTITLACHVMGMLTALANLARIVGVEFGPVIAANVVALLCILVSLRRVLKGTPEEVKTAEPTA